MYSKIHTYPIAALFSRIYTTIIFNVTVIQDLHDFASKKINSYGITKWLPYPAFINRDKSEILSLIICEFVKRHSEL